MWDLRFAAAAGAARVEAMVAAEAAADLVGAADGGAAVLEMLLAVGLVEEATPAVVTAAGGEEAVEFVDARAAAEGTGVWIPPCTRR